MCQASSAKPRITARESQILRWIAAGKSDWAIGRILNISDKTVNYHAENAKRKFGVSTRIQAVLAAARNGVLFR
jgi:DNA-binding CsgD family transcriptional regulator